MNFNVSIIYDKCLAFNFIIYVKIYPYIVLLLYTVRRFSGDAPSCGVARHLLKNMGISSELPISQENNIISSNKKRKRTMVSVNAGDDDTNDVITSNNMDDKDIQINIIEMNSNTSSSTTSSSSSTSSSYHAATATDNMNVVQQKEEDDLYLKKYGFLKEEVVSLNEPNPKMKVIYMMVLYVMSIYYCDHERKYCINFVHTYYYCLFKLRCWLIYMMYIYVFCITS